MSFADSFHEIIPGYRVNGRAVVTVVRSFKEGGIQNGSKLLDIVYVGVPNLTLIEAAEGERIPTGFVRVDNIDDIYATLELAGLSTVVNNVMVNPIAVGLLEYGEDFIYADAVGDGGRFTFVRDRQISQWKRDGDDFRVPNAQFDAFKIAVLERLSTVAEQAAQTANAYIDLDGVNDYIEFTSKGVGSADVLDFTADWSIGINLIDFEIKSDGQYITLFSSGQNAIMLRRGGTNYGLYLTGNGGSTKIGANTWYAPNPGAKLLFSFNATTSRLAYYIGTEEGGWAQRANYLVNVANIGGNNPGANFCIGKAVSNSLYYHGGLNNFLVANIPMAGPQISQYFQTVETYDEQEFYSDVTTWAKLGEDTFPAVTDFVGSMTGGSLVNGVEADFVVIETPGDTPDPSTPVVGTEVVYTPNYTFVGSSYNNSYENYSSGDAIFNTYEIDQIAVSSSFFTIYFVDAAAMAAWRATGRSVDLDPAATQTWEGTQILAASTEYSVNTSFNYVHYSLSVMLGSSAEADACASYLAQGGVGSTVCTMTFE